MVFYFSREGFYGSFSFKNPFFVKLSSTTPVMIKILYSVLRGLGWMTKIINCQPLLGIQHYRNYDKQNIVYMC
jgi:hypothetical protein